MWPNLPEIPLEDHDCLQHTHTYTHTEADMKRLSIKTSMDLRGYNQTGADMYTHLVGQLLTHIKNMHTLVSLLTQRA